MFFWYFCSSGFGLKAQLNQKVFLKESIKHWNFRHKIVWNFPVIGCAVFGSWLYFFPDTTYDVGSFCSGKWKMDNWDRSPTSWPSVRYQNLFQHGSGTTRWTCPCQRWTRSSSSCRCHRQSTQNAGWTWTGQRNYDASKNRLVIKQWCILF